MFHSIDFRRILFLRRTVNSFHKETHRFHKETHNLENYWWVQEGASISTIACVLRKSSRPQKGIVIIITLGMNKDKLTRAGLESTTSGQHAGALLLRYLAPFRQYLCSRVPVRSHTTVNCRVARDHTQITIQPGKRQPGDHLKGMQLFNNNIATKDALCDFCLFCVQVSVGQVISNATMADVLTAIYSTTFTTTVGTRVMRTTVIRIL